ncbi:transposable element Tcb1 transposase [Trichonephila clavipes]|nr:transposable element Tcb1 transposase [Trichonephila clavipes]
MLLNCCLFHRPTGPAPGVMVWWCGTEFHSRAHLVRIAGTLCYISEVLETDVISNIQRLPSAIFQQDNAQSHVARTVQEFFVTHQIELFLLPACSFNLSCV